MTFDFGQLIAHVAKTRDLVAGSIVGSGTVSNKETTVPDGRPRRAASATPASPSSARVETIVGGKPVTPFLRFGDRVRIEMLDGERPLDLRRDRPEDREARMRRLAPHQPGATAPAWRGPMASSRQRAVAAALQRFESPAALPLLRAQTGPGLLLAERGARAGREPAARGGCRRRTRRKTE